MSRGLTVTELLKFIPQSWKQTRPNTHQEYNSLRHFLAHGHLSEAFKSFSLLFLHKSFASHEYVLESTVSLLSACVEFNEFVPGKQVHAYCVRSGLEYDHVLVPKLVTFYSAFNFLHEAKVVTESSGVLCPLPWNVVIGSYVREKRFEEAVCAYERMVSKGIRPDGFTYPSVLKACGALLDFRLGRVVHGSVEVSSHKGGLYVCNALMSMYARFGKVDVARRLFERMSLRDVVSWNTVISCYASRGDLDEAFKFFRRMDVEANVVTWNVLAGGYLEIGNYVEALNVVVMMRKGNVSLDSVGLIIGLKACSHIGVIQWGKEFHCLAIRCCYDRIDNVRSSLITMYSRFDGLRHALAVFGLSEANSLSTWNSIVSGFAHEERSKETSFLLREMLHVGFHPNYVTLASILALCAKVAYLKHGKELHCYILRRQSFNNCLILWNCLVDMYAKSGKIVAAKRVYNSMSKRDIVTYTSLIDGYGMMGEGEIALAWFNGMIRSGIKPDHVTMVAVLSACNHSNLLRKGENMFNKMQSVFGLHPCLEHYSCMVDLYCRAGKLATARDIIRKIRNIRYEPTSAMCATLVIACLVHGNNEIGKWAADMLLLETKPKKLEHYVLVRDMYRASGSWCKLAKVEKILMSLEKAQHEFALVEKCYYSNVDSSGSCSINQEQSSDEEQNLVQVG